MLFGTDINNNWEFDEHGDLVVIKNKDNVGQAISNRLRTQLNELDLFYAGYGSFLTQFLGWKKNDSTLEFMRLEIETRLAGEPRLSGYSVRLEYTDNGVQIDMDLVLNDDDNVSVSESLVLTDDGIAVVGE